MTMYQDQAGKGLSVRGGRGGNNKRKAKQGGSGTCRRPLARFANTVE